MTSSPVLEIISIEAFSSTTVLDSTAWLTLTSAIKIHLGIAQTYYGFRVESPNFLEVAISVYKPHPRSCPTDLALPLRP
jgi:hypothetical protein